MDLKSLSLSQLVFQVKEQLNNTFDSPVWIAAEISELNVNYSGHCYLELIEKQEATDKLLAKSRATIWARVFRIIKPYFETSTRESLKAGLKVLVKVTVEFHEFYGFSLNIHDIDPSYTVGDLVLKRNIIIEKLTNEGVIDMNKGLELPMVTQRIAVITSETAAGYGDFKNQLENNAAGFHFNIKLFPAIMQGNTAPDSIVEAFNTIFEELDDFDAVVLIRGGGSKIDLSCFDDFDLSYVITQFPLPIITGIGHERDESVADLVANTSLKTPTAVAEFLVDILDAYWFRIQDAYNNLLSLSDQYFGEQNDHLKEMSSSIHYLIHSTFDSQFLKLENQQSILISAVNQMFRHKRSQLVSSGNALSVIAKGNVYQAKTLCGLRQKRLSKWLNNYLQNQNLKLDTLSSKIALVDPQKVLNRGYAIVSKNGKAMNNVDQLQQADEIEVTLAKGHFTGTVKSIDN